MASSPFIFPTTGVLPGLELVVNLNTALQLLATNNASSTAPVDPFLYQLWYNTATGQLTQWNGTEWVPTTFGAPLSSVNIISGGMTVTVDNLGTILEAQGATSYTIALPDPADFPSGNVAVFNNTTGGNNITVTTASGNFIGLGVTGASALLPPGFFALFISDGFNWVVNSTLGNALLNGSANQVFNVANAVQASNAVPLSQAQALFAALNGNTANAFAVANAPSANYAINLGQANSLYAQLAQSNTFEGVQNFASGVTTVASAGGVSAGTLPSGANGFIQANLPATFSGFFEQYYKGGTLVYSIDSSGNITANSLTAPTLDITGTATVPTATAVTSALQLQQVTNSTLNAAFANVQAAGNVNGSTISGGTVSGSTVAGGTGSFNTLSANSANIDALTVLNVALTNINATSIYGHTVSGGTISGSTISGGAAAFTNLTVSGTTTIQPATADNEAVNLGQLTNGSLAPTFAATVVASATASNEAVNLGQLTDGSLSPDFGNVTAGSQTTTGDQTIEGNLTVSGTAVVSPATASNEAVNLGQLFIVNRKAVFTSNGTWPVPDFVDTIWVSGCAGGGGGGSSGGGTSSAGGAGGAGGGAGEPVLKTPISVTPGHTLSITIGAAGVGGAAPASDTVGNNGTAGGNTVLEDSTSSTTLLTLTGGSGGDGGGGAGAANGAAPSSGYPGGGAGRDSIYSANGGTGGSGPFGGGGGLGRGAAGTSSGFPGNNGYGYGAGGGGGGGTYAASAATSGAAGGNGAPGFLVIEW